MEPTRNRLRKREVFVTDITYRPIGQESPNVARKISTCLEMKWLAIMVHS